MTQQIDLIPTTEPQEEDYRTEAEWLAVRRLAIGASEAPIILGVSPYKRPVQLFTEKLGLTEPERQTEAQAWGLLLEPAISERYAQETGHKLRDPGRYTLRRSREVPWLVATLDREVVFAADRSVPAPLELKVRAYAKPGAWEDEPPVDVLVQVQHQLAVTGWQWAAVAVLLGGREFRRFVVPRHEDFIAKLLVAEHAFMEQMRTKTLPAIDASEKTREALRSLYPKETPGLVVNLPGEAVEWDLERTQGMLDEKAGQERKRAAENKLLAALGEAETGVLVNGVSFTYKASERAGYTVPPSVVRTLRRKEPKA